MNREIVLKFPDHDSLLAFIKAAELKLMGIDQKACTISVILGEAEIELALQGFRAEIQL